MERKKLIQISMEETNSLKFSYYSDVCKIIRAQKWSLNIFSSKYLPQLLYYSGWYLRLSQKLQGKCDIQVPMILLVLLRLSMAPRITQYCKMFPSEKEREKNVVTLKMLTLPMTFWHLCLGRDPYKSNQYFELTCNNMTDIYFWDARNRESTLFRPQGIKILGHH